MMISQEYYAEDIKGMGMAELIAERDRLIGEIKGIEEAISDNDEIFVFQDPGPDTIHMHYHLYLIEVCRLISERGYEELDKVFKNKD